MKKSIEKKWPILLFVIITIFAIIDLLRGSLGQYSLIEDLKCEFDYEYVYTSDDKEFTDENCIPINSSDDIHTWMCTSRLGECG